MHAHRQLILEKEKTFEKLIKAKTCDRRILPLKNRPKSVTKFGCVVLRLKLRGVDNTKECIWNQKWLFISSGAIFCCKKICKPGVYNSSISMIGETWSQSWMFRASISVNNAFTFDFLRWFAQLKYFFTTFLILHSCLLFVCYCHFSRFVSISFFRIFAFECNHGSQNKFYQRKNISQKWRYV